MSNSMGWIMTSILTLQDMNAQIGNNYERKSLVEMLNKKTTEYGECKTQKLQYFPDYNDCNPSDLNAGKCALFKLVKEDRVIADEFYFQEASRSSPINLHFVDLLYKNSTIKEKYACNGCFFKARILALLERINYAPVEAEFEIFSSACKQTFSLVGIRTKNDNRNVDKLLVFNVYPGAKEGGGEAKNKKTFLVSCFKNTLEFLQVNIFDKKYIIDQTETIGIIDSDKPEVDLIDITKIFFRNNESDIISLYSEFKTNILNAFNLIFSDSKFTTTKRILLKKKEASPTVAEKKEETNWISDIETSVKTYFKEIKAPSTFKISVCVILCFLVIFIVRELTREPTSQRSKVKIL